MRRRAAALALIVLGCVAGFFCAEILARALLPHRNTLTRLNEFVEEETGKFARYDKTLGWDGRENASGDFEWIDCRFYVRHNGYGYRGEEYDPAKKNGRRFVVLGDSIVWGFGVENQEIFTRVIEQRARQPIEMVNMGVSGYGTDQEYLLWTEKGRLWKPEEVVLVVSLATDFWENTLSKRFEYPKPLFVYQPSGGLVLTNVPVPLKGAEWADEKQKVEIPGNRLVRSFLSRSVLAGLAVSAAAGNERARRFMEARHIIPAREPGYDHEYPLYHVNVDGQTYISWLAFFAILEKLNDDVRNNGATLTVVVAPSIVQVYPELWEKFTLKFDARTRANLNPDAPNLRIAKWAEAKHVRFIDLLPGLRTAAASNADLYYPVNIHWTAAGHRIVGDILARELAVGN